MNSVVAHICQIVAIVSNKHDNQNFSELSLIMCNDSIYYNHGKSSHNFDYYITITLLRTTEASYIRITSHEELKLCASDLSFSLVLHITRIGMYSIYVYKSDLPILRNRSLLLPGSN